MQKNQYILLLGAGLMQRRAIEAGRNLGYKILAVDANPKAVCVPFVDRFEPIDLKDIEAISSLGISLGDKLAAVFTTGTDFSASVSYVAQKCGLPSHTYEAALNASNKLLMRTCFNKSGVSSPEFQKITRSQLASFLKPGVLDKMIFPKVVKPIDNMGARGCRLIRNKNEFLNSVEDAIRYSKCGIAILEDYMEGPEFSIDAVVYKDTLTITGFADRHIFYQPYFIEMGHTIPTNIDEEKKLELIKCFAEGVKSLGLSCGVAKADIKYTNKGPMIGEIAARLSGGYMSGWTYPYASDLDLTEQALKIALGQEPSDLLIRRKPLPIKNVPFGIYEVPCIRTSAERAWISIPGKLDSLTGTNLVNAMPYTRNILVRSLPGDNVCFPRNNVEKNGNIIAVAPDRNNAIQAAENSISYIFMRLQKNNRETDFFLEGKSNITEENFPPDAYILPDEIKKEFEENIQNVPDVNTEFSIFDQIPVFIKSSMETVKDYNHRTIQKSLEIFESINHKKIILNGEKFWRTLIRGGVQGLIYICDCAVAK